MGWLLGLFVDSAHFGYRVCVTACGNRYNPQSPFFVLYTINILGAVRLLSFQGVMVIAIVDCSAYMVVSVLGVLGMLQWEDLPPLLVYWILFLASLACFWSES